MADRAAGQMQFVGGAPDAAVAGEAVEGAQRLSRGNSCNFCSRGEREFARAGKTFHFLADRRSSEPHSLTETNPSCLEDPVTTLGSSDRACLSGRIQRRCRHGRGRSSISARLPGANTSRPPGMSICCDEGFSVEEGSGGMPTAFCAHWTQRRRARRSACMPNMTRCRATARTRRPSSDRVRAWALRRAATPIRIPAWALPAWAGFCRPRRRCSATAYGHAALHRRAGGEGAGVEADPCRKRLLRRPCRHDLLPSFLHAAALQHGALGHALRRGLCDDLSLRLRRARKPGFAATAPRSRRRIRRCARPAPTTR